VNGLPNPSHSRAVLIGTSRFTKLPQLPAVRNNLSGLADLLRDDRILGLPAKHCVVIEDPVTSDDMLDPILDAAHEATDTLVVYYAGHGLPDLKSGELHLALVGSDRQRMYTAVFYGHVRDALLESQADRRVVMLDCCYSGRALRFMGGDRASAVVDQASAEGTYVMTATAENKEALAEPGEVYTAFTAELLATLHDGIPGRGKLLDMDTIFNHIRGNMRAKSRPIPQKSDRNTAGQLTLVRNQARRWTLGRNRARRKRHSMPPPMEAQPFEADGKARESADRRAREEQARQEREGTNRRAREEQARQEREGADRRVREEQARRAREDERQELGMEARRALEFLETIERLRAGPPGAGKPAGPLEL